MRPSISRLPRTEKTTAGSVGESAAPSRSAVRQSEPNPRCASTARAAAVTAVPATPSQVTAPATGRNRFQPIWIPPSNRMNTSASVTMSSSARWETVPRAGKTADATAAAMRKSAGVGDPDALAEPVRQDRSEQHGPRAREPRSWKDPASFNFSLLAMARENRRRPDFPAHHAGRTR
ncbi:MAG: hypothetical protein WDM88_03065 [Galbitalea sp.]